MPIGWGRFTIKIYSSSLDLREFYQRKKEDSLEHVTLTLLCKNTYAHFGLHAPYLTQLHHPIIIFTSDTEMTNNGNLKLEVF